MIYKCCKCNKEFNHKTHYDTHINRKYPCKGNDIVSVQSNTKLTEIQKSTLDENNKIIFQCQHCSKILSSNEILRRHINKYCNIKKNANMIKEHNDTTIIGMLEKMKNEIELLNEQYENLKDDNKNKIKLLNEQYVDLKDDSNYILKKVMKL